MEEMSFHGSEGISLYARHWRPDLAAVRGAVVLVHGMGEHSGRYEGIAEKLLERGLAVVAYDQRGHGRSPGKRGHSPSVNMLAGDAAAALDWTATFYPDVPLFLYGHSMGGNVALSCALRLKPAITGLILSSPWLKLAFDPPRVKQAFGRMISGFWPSLTLSTGMRGGALYRGESRLAADLADTLLHNRISAGLFFSLMKEGQWAVSHANELMLPVLLFHGTADRVTSLEASREAADRMGKQCNFISWDGGLHELHHDVDKERLLQLIADWVEARL